MSECSICGKSGFFLQTTQCKFATTIKNQDVQCEKELCEGCRYIIQWYSPSGSKRTEASICPNHIYKYLLEMELDELEELQEHGQIVQESGSTILVVRGENLDKILDNVIDDVKINNKKKMEEEVRKRTEQANNLFKAARYEDAALLFEQVGMWEEAGRARRKAKETVSKYIHVNANDLFSQIKREGLAIPYKCPNCAGVLKVTGDKQFTICPYCGSDIDLKTLSDLLDIML